MARQPKRNSLDAAVKGLLREMGVPTKKDIDKLQSAVDRLEKMMKKQAATPAPRGASGAPAKTASPRKLSATSTVLEAIKKSKKGATIETLQTKTGFDKKKIRNIVFRLHKLGEIQRVGRGVYIANA